MGARDRLVAWIESLLPWYDQDRAASRAEAYRKQLDESRKVRMAANHEVAASRRDRRSEMRTSYNRATRRLHGR